MVQSYNEEKQCIVLFAVDSVCMIDHSCQVICNFTILLIGGIHVRSKGKMKLSGTCTYSLHNYLTVP